MTLMKRRHSRSNRPSLRPKRDAIQELRVEGFACGVLSPPSYSVWRITTPFDPLPLHEVSRRGVPSIIDAIPAAPHRWMTDSRSLELFIHSDLHLPKTWLDDPILEFNFRPLSSIQETSINKQSPIWSKQVSSSSLAGGREPASSLRIPHLCSRSARCPSSTVTETQICHL